MSRRPSRGRLSAMMGDMHLGGSGLLIAAIAVAAGCGHPGSSGAPPSVSSSPGAGAASPATAVAGVTPSAARPRPAPAAVPRPLHTVVVVMENHSFSEIIGNRQAPFINGLARRGALLTSSYAVTHPSEPNYLALFSGSTQGVTGDQCPVTFGRPSLGSDAAAAGLTFAGYAEGLPARGSSACQSGGYARKHVPWADFSNIPPSESLPLASFPANYARLPALSFVIPDLCHDMHDCPVPAGDSWLAAHLAGYVAWALRHDSLLILTWDEDDGSQANHIATIFVGQQVRPGRYAQRITHYSVLRTIEDAYRLRRDGLAARAAPVEGIWRGSRH